MKIKKTIIARFTGLNGRSHGRTMPTGGNLTADPPPPPPKPKTKPPKMYF